MPINDVVSPIIQAFLQGQQLKRQKEQDAINAENQKQEAKLREQQAKKIKQEVDEFDRTADLRRKSEEINSKLQSLGFTKAVTEGISSGRLKRIDKNTIVPVGEGQTPDIPGAIGMMNQRSSTVNLDGQEIDVTNLPTAEEMRQTAQLNKEAELAPGFKNQVTLQENAQAFAKAQAADAQTFTEKQTSAGREFTKSQKELDRELTKKLAEDRVKVQTALQTASISAQEKMNNARIQAGNDRAAMKTAEKNLDLTAESDTIVNDVIMRGGVTTEGLKALDSRLAKAVALESAKRKLVILNNKQAETAGKMLEFNSILDKMERLAAKIGSGPGKLLDTAANKIPFVKTELGAEMEGLKVHLGTLARELGDRGALSNQDVERMGGALVVPGAVGGDVGKINKSRIALVKEIRKNAFFRLFPPGTNGVQILNMAEKLGIPPDEVKDKEVGKK